MDKSVKKQLAIIATFFDIEKFEVQYWLVDMIETEDGSATGQSDETFLQHIPMRNIIGYSSDTTNVMFRQYNSISQLPKSEFTYVQLVKCSCHLIHLVSFNAAVKLPKGKAGVDNFLTTCKNFLIESILQIQSQCDIDDPVHKIVQCLLPSNAAALKPHSLRSICQDTINLDKLDMQWRQDALEPKAKPELHWDEYWLNIRDTTTPTVVLEVSLLSLSEVPAHLIEFSVENMLAMGIDRMEDVEDMDYEDYGKTSVADLDELYVLFNDFTQCIAE
ncbi:Hypothetical predicted protein [Paramuricea clavata]|uniref:Uncharacterized protein n=1 Tax=Paramuricea clavata TaxID=317549 RepID=A0A6S7J1K8_PARCT|nr:Hypothetical predicted protein [Paramuricea clavata]